MSLINLTVPFQKGCWGKKPHISLNLQCKKFYNLVIFFGQNTVCVVELALHTILLVSINKLSVSFSPSLFFFSSLRECPKVSSSSLKYHCILQDQAELESL